MTITLYSRQGCHLCEAAEAVIRDIATDLATIEVIDIDADPALVERYTVRVPVVAIDGSEVAEFEIYPEQLRAEIERRAA